MIKFIYILSSLTAIVIVTACAATADPLNSVKKIEVVDNSKRLAIFTDNTLIGKYGFKGVGNFTSTYMFFCDKRKYQISVESVTDGISFKTIISGIETTTKTIRKQDLERINEDLIGVEIIGPVGLRCSLSDNVKNPINLVVNGGAVDSGTYHYKFVNSKFILTDDNFELKN